MFIEKIKSEGLAHLSWLIGDGNEAAVIDPRRDCEIYIEMASAAGCRITHVFETHRNEDLVSGASILADLTGARVHHGPNADGEVAYAHTVSDGDSFSFGSMQIKVLETPGHTDDSVSYVIYDKNFGCEPVGVFTGDALLIGDVGRTDFYPERAAEVAGLLFDSLRKLLALGDQAIVYPAHGAGSVCGSKMANREFSTLGYERLNNLMLQIHVRDEFISAKLAEHHEQPPYFRLMERLNLEGSSPAPRVLTPRALGLSDFDEAAKKAIIVDVRGIADFLGAHVPDSLAIPSDMVPVFAGWLLDSDCDLVLVAHDATQAESACRHLTRIGYDRVNGFLALALTGWASAARPFRSVAAVSMQQVADRVADPSQQWTLLDVRDRSERADGIIQGALPIYLGRLPEKLEELDRKRHYTVMCDSGARATIAASILLRSGFKQVDVFLGSIAAWKTVGQKTVKPD